MARKGKRKPTNKTANLRPPRFNSTLYGLGGGPVYTSRTVHRIFRIAMSDAKQRLGGAKRPLQIVSLPSAKFEQSTYSEHVGWLKGFFSDSYRYAVSILHNFQEEAPDLVAAAKMLEAADVLVMPGGSTEQAIAYWKRTGLDTLITAAVDRGVVIIGHSAGLIAWFAMMNTDSDSYGKPKGEAWSYKVSAALGLLPVWICPHAADNARKYTFNPDYGVRETRRDDFIDTLVASGNVAGIAVDGNTAIRVDGPTGQVTVLGDGEVTTHKRVGRSFISTLYLRGDTFNLYELAA